MLYQLSYSRINLGTYYLFGLATRLALPYPVNATLKKVGIPKGIRTPVTAVKGRCPRPLDDGDVSGAAHFTAISLKVNNLITFKDLAHLLSCPLKTPYYQSNGIPKGIRTPVTAVKGRCPRPLDDGDISINERAF